MISHDHKLIFIHIPKCAGRSIAEVFNTRPDHFTAQYYSQEYEKRWEEYDVFAIVRNPYDRLVSIYNYVQQHRRHPSEPIAARVGPLVPSFKEWVMANFKAMTRTFDPNSPEAEWGRDYKLGSPFWFSPQAAWLRHKGQKKNIHVFYLEYGTTPIYGFLKERGMSVSNIPHSNKSEWNGKATKDYYDEELLEFIRYKPFIAEDCLKFDYFHGGRVEADPSVIFK